MKPKTPKTQLENKGGFEKRRDERLVGGRHIVVVDVISSTSLSTVWSL